MNEIDLSVEIRGRLFRQLDRNAAIGGFMRDVVDDAVAQTYSEVMGNLNQSIRNPTPYYETQITATRRTGGGAGQTESTRRVHDRGIVYGPWLEGTSSRNSAQGFRGYRSFARAAVAVQARVPALVQRALTRAIARLGG